MQKLTKEQLKQIEDYLKSLPEEEREEKLKEIVSQYEQEPQCPFCLMAENKIQTTKIYEDENFLAVFEINPASQGHTILFPKRHIKYMQDLNEPETETLTKITKKLIFALANLADGITLVESEGKIAGQRFDHLAINFIPRHKKDTVIIEWQSKKTSPEELEKLKQKIAENFPKEKQKEQPVDEERLRKELAKLKKRLP